MCNVLFDFTCVLRLFNLCLTGYKFQHNRNVRGTISSVERIKIEREKLDRENQEREIKFESEKLDRRERVKEREEREKERELNFDIDTRLVPRFQ